MVKGEALLFLSGALFFLKTFYSASHSSHNEEGSNVLINRVLFLQEALFKYSSLVPRSGLLAFVLSSDCWYLHSSTFFGSPDSNTAGTSIPGNSQAGYTPAATISYPGKNQ